MLCLLDQLYFGFPASASVQGRPQVFEKHSSSTVSAARNPSQVVSRHQPVWLLLEPRSASVMLRTETHLFISVFIDLFLNPGSRGSSSVTQPAGDLLYCGVVCFNHRGKAYILSTSPLVRPAWAQQYVLSFHHCGHAPA